MKKTCICNAVGTYGLLKLSLFHKQYSITIIYTAFTLMVSISGTYRGMYILCYGGLNQDKGLGNDGVYHQPLMIRQDLNELRKQTCGYWGRTLQTEGPVHAKALWPPCTQIMWEAVSRSVGLEKKVKGESGNNEMGRVIGFCLQNM